jgi:1-deoxyxylulose-5-phosphate synthase
MQFTRLGNTGLKVSRICLGCMSFGAPGKWLHPWVLDEEKARPYIKQALDVGINFFDTANVYSLGSSEEITGRALRDFAKRDEIILATKVHGQMRQNPNGQGLSRKAIFMEIDMSLRRLGMDHVDLYQIHRWDNNTPIEETLEALHDVVKAGKARYIGASSMYAWQFAKALFLSTQHGWTRFVSMQNFYNLIYREEEREMMKLCVDQGIAVIPWSPLARGRLARPWDKKDSTDRAQTDEFGKRLYAKANESDQTIVDRVNALATKHNTSPATVALAWQFTKPYVTSPIIGATKPGHLEAAVASLELKLSPEEIAELEEPYLPHPVAGFQ